MDRFSLPLMNIPLASWKTLEYPYFAHWSSNPTDLLYPSGRCGFRGQSGYLLEAAPLSFSHRQLVGHMVTQQHGATILFPIWESTLPNKHNKHEFIMACDGKSGNIFDIYYTQRYNIQQQYGLIPHGNFSWCTWWLFIGFEGTLFSDNHLNQQYNHGK